MKDFNFREAALEAERKVLAEMRDNGKVVGFEFGEDAVISEMVGTADGAKEFLEKITYDLATGQQSVPLLYKSIYETRTDANFPMVMTEKSFGNVETVFLEKFEGGEIKFGAIGAGQESTVRMHTWAAAMEYDEDITEYNQTWRVSQIGESFGVSWNNLLNNLHLDPIINGVYDTAHKVTAATATTSQLADAIKRQKGTEDTPGVGQYVVGDLGDADTWKVVAQILPKGSILLHSSYDELTIRNTLATDIMVNGEVSPTSRKVQSYEFIAYDGVSFSVGPDEYSYPGVDIGEAFVVTPKAQFKELIKHDLRVDTGDGDLTRLIVAQVVARARRGLLAGLGGVNGAVKVAAS